MLRGQNANRGAAVTLKALKKFNVINTSVKHLCLVTIMFGLSLLMFPVWFTQNVNSIDEWIYWGAGDNPTLSYLNNFGDLYYLQRYLVLLPQIISHGIFGPFYSQMITALFWILLSTYFASKISRLFISEKLTILLILGIFTSRGLLVSFGSNLHHAPTISLTFCLFFLLLKRDQITNKKTTKINLLLIGVTYAAIANTYLIIAVYLFLPIFGILLFEFIKKDLQQTPVHREENQTRFPNFVKKIVILAAGFTFASVIFELIHQAVSNATAPILFQQVRLGSGLLSEENLWNGLGFASYWTAGVWQFNSMPWVLLVIVILIINFGLNRKVTLDTRVQIVSLGILVSMAGTTLGYSSPTWHTFTACVLVPVYFLSISTGIKELQKHCSESIIQRILICLLFGKIVFQLFWMHTKSNDLNSFKDLIWITVFISATLAVFLYMQFKSNDLLKFRRQFAAVLTTIALFAFLFASVPQSLLQLYTGENPTFRSYSQANAFYEKLSDMRSTILDESKSGYTDNRVWLTPDEIPSLVSSQLYAYSLISFSPGVADCSQVNWALQKGNAKIMSFSSKNITSEGFDIYLKPCGAKVEGFALIEKDRHHETVQVPYAVAKVLPK